MTVGDSDYRIIGLSGMGASLGLIALAGLGFWPRLFLVPDWGAGWLND